MKVFSHDFTKPIRRLVVIGAWSVALSAAPALAQTSYTITKLAGANCAVSGINDFGEAVGQCDGTATVWKNGAPTTLGRLAGGTYSLAEAINSREVTVGNGDTGDSRPKALLFRAGKVINIDPSAANAYAIYINDNGAIVGNALKGFGTCNSWVAAIYTEDPSKPGTFKRLDLQPYPGGDGKVRCEFATGANQSLQVVGYVQSSLFGQRGAFWNNDAKHTLALLQPYADDWTSYAWAVNDLGETVGESHPPFGNRPVIWKNDTQHTPVELPLLPGDNYGAATAANNVGGILGTSAYNVPGTWNVGLSRVVLWQDGNVFDLQSLLDAVSGAGWVINSAAAINNLGQIVGSGVYNGDMAVFVMTPTP